MFLGESSSSKKQVLFAYPAAVATTSLAVATDIILVETTIATAATTSTNDTEFPLAGIQLKVSSTAYVAWRNSINTNCFGSMMFTLSG